MSARCIKYSTMMWHGLYNFSRLSSTALISQNCFPSSPKYLSIHLRRLSTATPKASPSLVVQPTNERYDLFFSEGPNPPMFTPNKGGPGCSEDISDREWHIRTDLPIITILFDRLLLCRPRHLYPTANTSRFLRCWPCLKYRPHKDTDSH
jgi:hypothetical protein